MKKRYLFPCVMLVICMMLTACTTPSQNVSNNTPPATEQPATEQPSALTDTEAPSEEPIESTPEPNAELFSLDRDAVLAFLETEDENGVKNGEKIHPSYNPLDYKTWHCGLSEMNNVIGFAFNSDGRLSSVDLRGEHTRNGKLVGALNLDGCYDLKSVIVSGQDIESIYIISDLYILDVSDCPELETIGAEFPNVKITNCRIENCPKINWFSWLVDGRLVEDPVEVGKDYYTLDSEIELRSEGGGRFDLLIDYGTDENPDIAPYIRAVPDPGHEFLGWYRNNGELLSTDLELMIFDGRDNPSPNLFDLVDSFFMFITARFSE